jgi:hypothetical protein
LKTLALVAVQRLPNVSVGASAGETRAAVIEDLSKSEVDRVLTDVVDPNAHLMSDEWKAFVSLGMCPTLRTMPSISAPPVAAPFSLGRPMARTVARASDEKSGLALLG